MSSKRDFVWNYVNDEYIDAGMTEQTVLLSIGI